MFSILTKYFNKSGQRDKHDRYRAGQEYGEHLWHLCPIPVIKVRLTKADVDPQDPYWKGVIDMLREKGVIK